MKEVVPWFCTHSGGMYRELMVACNGTIIPKPFIFSYPFFFFLSTEEKDFHDGLEMCAVPVDEKATCVSLVCIAFMVDGGGCGGGGGEGGRNSHSDITFADTYIHRLLSATFFTITFQPPAGTVLATF